MAKPDEDREAERAAILRRRAQLAACAVAASISLPNCSGRTCLEPPGPGPGGASGAAGDGAGGSAVAGGAGGSTSGGVGGAAVPCLSVGGTVSSGGTSDGGLSFCLSIAGGAGGAGGTGGAAGGQAGTGGVAICLSLK